MKCVDDNTTDDCGRKAFLKRRDKTQRAFLAHINIL